MGASQFSSNPATMLPVIYEQKFGYDPTRLWDFKTTMDVVILAGGANDFIGTAGSGAMADPNNFSQVYSAWMKRIRSRYPNALIVAAIGASVKNSDRTLMAQYLGSALIQAQGPAGDANMIYFDYFANDPNGWTTYGDVAGHGSKWLADRLTPVIRSHMDW